MSLLTAELRKVWGNRVFPMLLAVLVCAMRMLCRRGDREREGQDDDAGEEDRTQAGWHGRGKWRQAIRGA